MTKRKANISPELVGSVFTDGEDYFTLVDCQTELKATIQRLYPGDDENSNPVTKSISEFSDLVMVKPVKKIEKKQKKSRADKGGTHRKPTAKPVVTITPELQEMEEGLNSEGLTLKEGDNLPDISSFA